MRRALRLALVIVLTILLAGCSASRRRRSAEAGTVIGTADFSAVASMVTGNNITGGGFVIRRGKLEMDGTSVEGTFAFTARINSDGDFVASVRGPLGIELVRLLAVGKEIAVIDRLSRIVYTGNKDEVMRKYGLPGDFLRILFGDMPAMHDARFEARTKNELVVRTEEGNAEREVSICIDELKVCRQTVKSRESGQEIMMLFSDFRSDGGKKYASHIEMREAMRRVHVIVTIEELVADFDENIEFNIPPYRRSSI